MSALDELAKLLRAAPRTAKEIARIMKCSKPTAYRRIEALKERGEAVYELAQASKCSGPVPLAFGLR